MATKKKRAYGAPAIKPARKGEKYQLGVIVSGVTKKALVEAIKVSGRSISREAEHLIERCLHYDRMMDAMRTNLAQMEKGNVEAVLHRLGYRPMRDLATGKVAWCEPGHPAIVGHTATAGRVGFEPWQPGELEATLEQTAIMRRAAGISDEEFERRTREKLEEADKRPLWDADAAFDRLAEIEEAAGLPAPKKDDDPA
jgi:hypothetical protein